MNPSLYQINARVRLTALAHELGRPATLDDIPDSELDHFAKEGFDWIWFLSVWQTGLASRQISRSLQTLRKEFEETLPDLQETDIEGSGFAITGYTVHHALGGDSALARLRQRLRERNLNLMLDFVPNHTGLDHPWVEEHPEYYIRGNEEDLASAPANWTWANRKSGNLILAHGRDPYFPGWTDTFQLNYGNSDTQEAMIAELKRVAAQCDGVRCDMAMLVLPDIFQRTWNIPAQPFWPRAIASVREHFPKFCFMAEVYWDLEWTLQQLGFNYTYDKRLYDRLRAGNAIPVREHLQADLDYQNKMARFLENHDEPRAASTFPPDVHKAAAAITFLSPGLRFFHQGQLEGRKKRISPHLIRGPQEPVDEDLAKFYHQLLAVLRIPALRNGQWQLLECVQAWQGNSTWSNFVVSWWQGQDGERLLVAVNYSEASSQCYVRLPFADLAAGEWLLTDLLSNTVYERNGKDLLDHGLYLDESPWKAIVFKLTSKSH